MSQGKTREEAHLEDHLYTRVALERRHDQLARDWIGRFSRRLRTLDGLHLAVAASEGRQLVTSDATLAQAGSRLGVDVLQSSSSDG